MTQSQLAEKIGIGTRTILEIENNRGNPRFDILVAIVHELNIPSDSIFHLRPIHSEEVIKRLLLELEHCSEKEKQLVLNAALHLVQGLKNMQSLDKIF